MKIGYDAKRANANNTGLGNYSRFVISALSLYAPQNNYLLYLPKRRHNHEYESLLTDHPMLGERLPSKPIWRGVLSSLWRTLNIGADLKREGVEIFHGLSNEIPIGLAKRGIKSVVTIHDLIFLRLPEGYRPLDRWIYNLKFRYACRHADHIIAVSECTKRDIIEIYSIDPDKISVIYQGCAPHFTPTHTPSQHAEIRERYSLPARYLLNVGTLESRKNLMLCVKTLEHLDSDIHLVACGRATPYTEHVMRYAAERGLQERVHLIHNTQYLDLPHLYQMAEVSLYPSYYEGFGIPIIESLSCGTPVVAATGSCLEEAGGDAALYVAPDDAVGCAAAVRRFLEDGAFREAATLRGLRYVERFSKERIASDIAELYKEL